ncbi:MAG: hypothetical protein KatS3mg076_0777 [Candidatus Binatia bacterium]|nr:MAG: hypothetical protein KatS3mg076_0777 [Candidatus Binatia bacterium]
MRMILPPLRQRRQIHRSLSEFFQTHKMTEFNRAIAAICRFYGLPKPKVQWFEYIDWGRTVGRTYEDGKVHLVHPENWKSGRKYNSERQWINAVYHEMGHYIFWADAERKADTFAQRMERGLDFRRNGNGRHPAAKNGRPPRRGRTRG